MLCYLEALFLYVSVLTNPICLNYCYMFIRLLEDPLTSYADVSLKLAGKLPHVFDYPVSLTYMENDVALQLLRFHLVLK